METVTFQNPDNGFAVVNIVDKNGELICVVGTLAGSVPGEELTLLGRYIEHPSYGIQFEVASCSFRLPEEEGAILKYLSSGVLPGIGPALARRIVEKFGGSTLEVIASAPEKLGGIRGLTPVKAKEASQAFLEKFGLREAITALGAWGLTAAESIALYKNYDRQTVDVIHANPYILCGSPLYISFVRADAIASQLGFDREGQERNRAAILYTLRHNLNNGHTCLPKEKLLDTTSSFFGISLAAATEALEALCVDGQVQVALASERGFAYLGDYMRAEITSALHLRALAERQFKQPTTLERLIALRGQATGIEYAPLQKSAIVSALSSGAMVITGGPGTGKTTTVNAIISLLEQEAERVALAAPTGRAAKRLSELTGRKAMTIHRLLEVDFRSGPNLLRFVHNIGNPLKYDVVIVDEMSMVDALLFESLLMALKPTCRLIMVGDTDQLPSVGAGNVLKGIIESDILPVVRLTEIFRQAAVSLIVSNAHRIVRGDIPEKGGKNDDFFFLGAQGERAQQLICDLAAQRLPASYGFSPFSDIQVLCPGRKGMLGTELLGARLQQCLNPSAPERPEIQRGGITYRLGDKVMQTRNNYDIPYTREDGEPGAGAFNGDIGIITEVDTRGGAITVLCEDRRVFYTQDNLHELEPAYAVTIHKSQGSEFEAVVIPVTDVPGKLQYRNLLYTGVTRARRLCVLVGEEAVVKAMVHNDRRNNRFSCFAHFLKDDELL